MRQGCFAWLALWSVLSGCSWTRAQLATRTESAPNQAVTSRSEATEQTPQEPPQDSATSPARDEEVVLVAGALDGHADVDVELRESDEWSVAEAGDATAGQGSESALVQEHGAENASGHDTEAGTGVAGLPADAAAGPANQLQLDDVVSSVYANFPLLEVARFERNIANGSIVSAQGGFDTKLKATTENGPLGYYQTYRHSVGVTQPLYGGAEVFGGYRIGRGEFQPWYQERQTNGNGEFKGGVQVPLARNREIDARRAELWKATYARQRTEPEIQIQLIEFIRDGSLQYWEWVAAAQKLGVAERLLKLASDRNSGIRKRVAEGDLDPPDADDNQRIIVSREAKVIDARRKAEQSAVKLSLYLRDDRGFPIIPRSEWTPDFPELEEPAPERLSGDISVALTRRPELLAIDILRREVDIDYASARNDFRPQVDALIVGSQDNGTPTSSKKDKSPFELEAGVYAEVPIQRRKARGKMSAIEAKVSQLIAKRQMLENKISTEVQNSHLALEATWKRVQKAREAVRLARYMAEVEQTKFTEGTSDLLSVNLREQQAAEAAETEVDALLEYFQSRAVYRAAMAEDNDYGFGH